MKTLRILLTGALLLSGLISAFAQGNDRNLARVSRLQGYETYVMCDPLRDYDVVFDIATGAKASSLLTGGLVNEGVSDKITQFVNRAMKQAKKDGKEFDAVLISGGKTAVAIKFKDAATEKNRSIGRVKKLNGLDVYVMNEPLSQYETVLDTRGGAKAKSYLTGGMVNNSIEEDMAQFVKRIIKEAEEEKKTIDAVVYSGGKSAIAVKIK
ncbi:MAG: hypothetical protein LH606_02475 [Cytophagaceae bacterium]|nr:hypothetical protein [Cytophagaceae bacterium]